jgi:hypothetical protein
MRLLIDRDGMHRATAPRQVVPIEGDSKLCRDYWEIKIQEQKDGSITQRPVLIHARTQTHPFGMWLSV